MARILGALPAALLAASNGMSANAFYRELQASGYGARRSEVLALYRNVRTILVAAPEEPFRDITQVPQSHELTPWPTRKATGIAQTVQLLYRDRATGEIQKAYWRTSSQTGLTRETAMATAIDAYSAHTEAYGQDLIGAIHTGAYQNIPFGA
jgi:hypothetical protein